MKKIKTLLLVAITVSFFSCDIKDPVDGLEVRLNTITRETLVTGYVYDAKTGNTIEQNVSVTFSGSNAGLMIDETNDLKNSFTAKNGLFNFGIKDGAVLNKDNPLKVLVTLQTPGYLDVTTPVSFTKKGVQSVTFFMAKKEDFSGSIIVNDNIPVATANNSGTVTTDTEITTADGIIIFIPAGSSFKTSTGSPLTGNLTIDIQTIVYNSSSKTLPLIPRSVGTNENSSIIPFLNFRLDIRDQNGQQAAAVDSIKFRIPLPQDFTASAGKYFGPHNEMSLWKQTDNPFDFWMLNPIGNFFKSFSFQNIFGQLFSSPIFNIPYLDLSFFGFNFADYLLPFQNMLNLFIGPYTSTCSTTLSINNPKDGYDLQIFKTDVDGTVLVDAFSNIPDEIDLSRQSSDPAATYEFKSGANTVTGLGGISYGTYNMGEGCGTSGSVTLNYPAVSIQASINVNGVCTSRDPVVRVYPSVTFNYRVKGSSTWQQGSLSNGEVVIAGLTPNTTYEAKATYRDKEASVEIHVIDAANFETRASSNPGSLLSVENTGTSQVDGQTIVNLKIEIDLKDDCD